MQGEVRENIYYVSVYVQNWGVMCDEIGNSAMALGCILWVSRVRGVTCT